MWAPSNARAFSVRRKGLKTGHVYFNAELVETMWIQFRRTLAVLREI